jgi:hypothetical protein
LGDTALSDGITEFIEDIKELYPGIFVHSVQIPEGGTIDAERKAGFVSVVAFGSSKTWLPDGTVSVLVVCLAELSPSSGQRSLPIRLIVLVMRSRQASEMR